MRVSVLMPCYNAAPYLRQAVESVLNQSWHELELVVVNDGSTDDSLAILKSIKDPRLKIIDQPNKGQCAAANRAFADASGDLIKFFDADDVLSPDHIKRQVVRLGARRDAVAMGEWARFYGEDITEAEFKPLPMYRDAKPVEWLSAEWMNARPMMQCALWLIPRQIIDRSGLWDERLSLINDFEFFARVLMCTKQILFTPGARVYYRSGVSGSLSGSRSRKAVESAFQSLMLGTEHLLACTDTVEARRACANLLADFDYSYYPAHADLRARARARADDLGGSTIPPDGPPAFQRLRRVVGWRAARRVQLLAERFRAFRRAHTKRAGDV